jgi:hypothetical protein
VALQGFGSPRSSEKRESGEKKLRSFDISVPLARCNCRLFVDTCLDQEVLGNCQALQAHLSPNGAGISSPGLPRRAAATLGRGAGIQQPQRGCVSPHGHKWVRGRPKASPSPLSRWGQFPTFTGVRLSRTGRPHRDCPGWGADSRPLICPRTEVRGVSSLESAESSNGVSIRDVS